MNPLCDLSLSFSLSLSPSHTHALSLPLSVRSNDRFYAPEHRVVSHSTKVRYSAPFFYNPAFETTVEPLPVLGDPKYEALSWGYFRAQRFAGDFADWGSEIQIRDFAKASPSSDSARSWHIANQERFLRTIDFATPFDLEASKDLLVQQHAK